MNSKRTSNFELLRIWAMILIIISHIFVHGINMQIYNENYSIAGELFNNLFVYRKLIITYYGALLGQVGNAIFFLISGYFLIEKEHINLVKKIEKILSQTLYVTIVLVFISVIFIKNNLIKIGAVSLNQFNDGWWFAAIYIFTIVCAELFLNKYLAKMTKHEYIMCLLVCYSFIGIGFLRVTISSLASGLESLISCIFVYMLGGYIKKYKFMNQIKTYFLIMLFIILVIILAISYYNYNMNNINQAILDNVEEYRQVEYGYKSIYTLPCIVIATINFEIFRRIKIKPNNIINNIANATFMMYLIHETSLGRELFMKIKWNYILFNGDYIKLCSLIFIIILIIMLLGVIFYSIYRILILLVNNNTIKKLYIKI